MSHVACAVLMSGDRMLRAAQIATLHRPDVVAIIASHHGSGCAIGTAVGAELATAKLAGRLVEAELRFSGVAVEDVAASVIESRILDALVRSGWRGRTLALWVPRDLRGRDAHAAAHALARTARASGKRWALVAGSDDVAREIVRAAAGASSGARALGAGDAVLFEEATHPHALPWHLGGEEPFVSAIATAARGALAASLAGVPYQPELEGGEPRYGVIVTLRSEDGRVRTARGILGGEGRSLVEQVVAAATSLPRDAVPPLGTDELDELSVELSLLGSPQPVHNLDQLDPARYGVIVEQDGHRGLLPPRVDGIDSALDQVMSACQSAEIDLRRPFQLFRFDVDCVTEPANRFN